MKAKYELTLVFSEEDEEYRKKIEKLLEGFVKKVSGELENQEDWRVRKLAYPIQRQKTGYYRHFVFTMDTQQQPNLKEKLDLEEKILRYLFIRV